MVNEKKLMGSIGLHVNLLLLNHFSSIMNSISDAIQKHDIDAESQTLQDEAGNSQTHIESNGISREM